MNHRPATASHSPSSASAITLLPLPGPPVRITTVFESPPPRGLGGVQDKVERAPLLVEQDELLAIADLGSCDRSQCRLGAAREARNRSA